MKPKLPPFKQMGNLLVPTSLPEAIGFGCPKCDECELIPPNQRWDEVAIASAFMKKHATCGTQELHQLERRQGGELVRTGLLPLAQVVGPWVPDA